MNSQPTVNIYFVWLDDQSGSHRTENVKNMWICSGKTIADACLEIQLRESIQSWSDGEGAFIKILKNVSCTIGEDRIPLGMKVEDVNTCRETPIVLHMDRPLDLNREDDARFAREGTDIVQASVLELDPSQCSIHSRRTVEDVYACHKSPRVLHMNHSLDGSIKCDQRLLREKNEIDEICNSESKLTEAKGLLQGITSNFARIYDFGLDKGDGLQIGDLLKAIEGIEGIDWNYKLYTEDTWITFDTYESPILAEKGTPINCRPIAEVFDTNTWETIRKVHSMVSNGNRCRITRKDLSVLRKAVVLELDPAVIVF